MNRWRARQGGAGAGGDGRRAARAVGAFMVVLAGVVSAVFAVRASGQTAAPAEAENGTTDAPALVVTSSAPAGPAVTPPMGHGWAVLPDMRRTPTQYRLLHLPPRSAEGVKPGSVGLAKVLDERPDAIAGEGDRVYVVFGPARMRVPAGAGGGGGEKDNGPPELVSELRRRVLSLRAVPVIGGRWEMLPRGRMQPEPTLPGGSDLAGFASTGFGPAALLRERADADGGEAPAAGWERGRWSLYLYGALAWRRITLPWEEGAAFGDGAPVEGEDADVSLPAPPGVMSTCDLIAQPGAVGVLVRETDPASGVLWIGRMALTSDAEDRGGPADGTPGLVWSSRSVRLGLPDTGGGANSTGVAAADTVLGVDGQLVAMRWRPAGDSAGGAGVVDVFAAREESVSRLATIEDVPASYHAVGVDGAGVAAVLWLARAPDGDGPASREQASLGARSPQLELREVSVSTGRVMFSGDARPEGPVSATEFRLLTALMVGVMALVLLFVLRPESRPARTAAGGEGAGEDGEGGGELPAGAILRPASRLPPALVLAGPGARLLAATADFSIAVGLTLMVQGGSVQQLFAPIVNPGAASSLAPLLTALAVAIAHGALGEWLGGRTIGKALTGCRVVTVWRVVRPGEAARGADAERANPERARRIEAREHGTDEEEGAAKREGEDLLVMRPTLSQAVLRNLVKWGALPLTIGVMLDPFRRHFGDLMAQTFVVEAAQRRPDSLAEASE